jgi:hypothetical protein
VDQRKEPAVVDILAERRKHDSEVQAPEAIGDVPFDEPVCSFPGFGDLPQSGVAAPAWAEPV